MKKILKKIRTICVVSVLSVSICFTSVGGSYYQAAALAPAIWTLIETLFLSLGVTFMISEAVDTDEIDDAIVADIRAFADGVQSEQKKSVLQEAADCISNIHNYWEPVTGLTIPQAVWEGLKYYAGERAAARPIYHPSDASINLYGCTLTQYREYLASLFGVSSTDSYITKFANASYDDFVLYDYSGLLLRYPFSTDSTTGRKYGYCVYHSLMNVKSLRWREFNKSSYTSYVLVARDGVEISSYKYGSTLEYDLCAVKYYCDDLSLISYSSGKSTSFGSPIDGSSSEIGFDTSKHVQADFSYLLISHGLVYDLFDVLQYPVNSSSGLDFGNEVNCLNDFGIPTTEVYTGVTSSAVSGVVDVPADDYDILTPGRDWDKEEEKVVGDVVIGIPTGNALDDYRNGLITWDELMQEIGAKPVDSSKGETLDGTPIVDAIIDTSSNIIDVILSIPQVLLDGIVSLFVPAEGYFADYFSRLNDFFNEKLGFLWAPVGILIDILEALASSDNTNSGIVFPGVKYDSYTIIEKQTVYIDDYIKDYADLQDAIYFIGNLIMSGCVLHLLQMKIKEMMVN